MQWSRRGHDREANCAGMMGSHMAKREGHPSASPSDCSGMLQTLLFPYMCLCVYVCVCVCVSGRDTHAYTPEDEWM